ncbi:GMC family oxidoreductase [Virgibacillus sp. CBA3643]|uniref:GMC family oxidoreductase n=1 Tax=Virgibacillus sp. CBA3643 TaxID=2942278 RepID=UPI0035A29220
MAKKLDKVDAVVVGLSWSGGITAAELTKKGYKVVGLERGKDQKVEDFIGSKDELKYQQRHEMMQDLSIESITSRNDTDEEAEPIRSHDDFQAGNDLGGGGVHWSGASFRYQPYDFEIYSKTVERYGKEKIPEDMTIQDWGITYNEFEKYYDKFEKTAGISGEENPIGPERSDEYPNPPMVDTPNIKLFKDAAENLGYHPYQHPSANNTTNYENPDGQTIHQCQYCAFCTTYGCDFGAKGDPVVTVLPTAQETGNFEIRTKSMATRVLYDGEKATGVLYVDLDTGKKYEQPADIVVLGAFTFSNTRLLLLSEIGEPYDPDTGEGVIGKNFTGHLGQNPRGYAFFDDKKFNLYMGAGALGATFDDFSADNIDHSDLDFLHGGEVETRQYGAVPIGYNHVPNGTPSWGKEFKEKSVFYHNRTVYTRFQMAVLPMKQHYMDLDPNYKDINGDPLLRMTYDFTDQDKNLSQYGAKILEEVLEEMGADSIKIEEMADKFPNVYSGGHYAGGVIMGKEPETSAVNNYLQMWDAENVFVVGASAFPHFGNYNPTETVGALAYRASEGMIEYLEGDGGLLVDPVEEKEESNS